MVSTVYDPTANFVEEPIPGADEGSWENQKKSSQKSSQGVSEASTGSSPAPSEGTPASDFPVPASSSPSYTPEPAKKAKYIPKIETRENTAKEGSKKEALAATYALSEIVGDIEMSPEEMYFNMSQELDDLGRSPQLDNVKSVLGNKFVEQSQAAARNIIEDDSLDNKQKTEIIRGIAERVDQGLSTVDMMVETATAKAMGQRPEAAQDLIDYQNTADNIRDMVIGFQQAEFQPELTMDGDWLQKLSAGSQYVGGIINMGLPYVPGIELGYNEGMKRFQQAMAPEDSQLYDIFMGLAPGEMVNKVQETLMSKSGDEAEAYAQKILDAVREIRQPYSDQASKGHYTIQDMYLLSEIFSPYLEGEEFDNIDRAILDAEGGLSALPSAWGVVKGLMFVAKGGTAIKNSMKANSIGDKMREVNPEEARGTQNRILATGDEEAAQAFTGRTIDQQLEAMLYPKTTEEMADLTVEAFDPVALMSNPALFSKEEIQAIGQQFIKQTERELLSGAVLQEGNTVLKQDKRGAPIVSALYGEGKGVGFANKADAEQTMADLFGENANVQFLKETKKGLVEAEEGYQGKVFARIDRAQVYDSFAYKLIEGEQLEPTGVRTLGILETISARTPLELLPRGRGSMFERGGAAQYKMARLEEMFGREALDQIMKLSNRSIDKLDNAIMGSVGKKMSMGEIKSQYNLNKKEYNALAAFRNHQDNMFLINNFTEYSKLKAKGAQTIEVGENSFTASPTSWDSLKEREAFYYVSKEGVNKITRKAAEQMNAQWFRTRKATEEVPGGSVIAFAEDASPQYKPLDPRQLNYIDNYYTRMYDMNYVIRAWDKETGEEMGAIAGTKSRKRAEELKKELAANYPNFDLEQTRATELAPADLDSAISLGSNTRGLFFSPRQQEALLEADTLRPIESLVRSSGIMARRLSTKQAIDIDVEKWAATYGDKATIIHDGKPMMLRDHPSLQGDTKVLPSEEVIKSANWGDRRDMVDALVYAKDINNRAGMRNLAERRAVANFMLTAAEAFERNGILGRWVADALYEHAGDFNVISDIRRYNFYTLLALNPQRQFILQAAQPLFVSGIAPRDFLPGVVKGQQLFYWYNRRGINKDFMPSSKEDKELFKAAIESGVFQNISHHTFTRDMAAGISGGKAGEQSLKWAGQLMQGIRRVGFDAGEAQNQAMTFAIVARQYKRQNPKADLTDRNVIDELAARTREYTLSMDQRGEPGYANGLWSIPLQFMSIQHKAMLSWMPKTLGGNKYFTTQQKWGIAAAQATLFGAEGLGLKKVVDPILNELELEATDENYVALYGGLMDWSFLQLTGDDLSISGSFAPGGTGLTTMASDVAQVVSDMIMYGKSPTLLEAGEAALGPTGSSLGKLYRMGQALDYMSDAHKGPMNFTAEDWELIGHRIGQTFASGYSNYLKSKLAMSYGYNYSMNTGQGYGNATANEAIAKFFGIGTHSEDRTFEAISKMVEESKFEYSGEQAEADGRQAAKTAMGLFLQRLHEHGVVGYDGKRYTSKNIPRAGEGENFDQSMVMSSLAYKFFFEELKAVDRLAAHIDNPSEREMFKNGFAKEIQKGLAGGTYPVMNDITNLIIGAPSGKKADLFFNQLQAMCRASGNEKCKQAIADGKKVLEDFEQSEEWANTQQDMKEVMQ